MRAKANAARQRATTAAKRGFVLRDWTQRVVGRCLTVQARLHVPGLGPVTQTVRLALKPSGFDLAEQTELARHLLVSWAQMVAHRTSHGRDAEAPCERCRAGEAWPDVEIGGDRKARAKTATGGVGS